jgi:MFS family permease
MSSTSQASVLPVEGLSRAALVVLSLGALDFGLEQAVVIPALPSLAKHYDASLIAISWLATGFLLASIVAVPLLGRLGDLYGKRRLLLGSLTAVAAGSVLCAITHSIELAIAGRAIQGLGAAVTPLTLGLARDLVAPTQLTRVIGIVVGAANAGAAIGYLLSGVLVDLFSPAATFWFLFVMAVVLAAAVLGLVEETPVRTQVSLDVAGALLISVGLVSLLLAISKGQAWGWSSGAVVGLFASAGAVLALFAFVERRLAQPMVDLRLVVARPFAYANLCAFVFGYGFFIAVFAIPQLASAPEESGYGLALSTTGIGFLLAPTSIAGLVGAWTGGRIVDRVGPRALAAAGSLVGVLGYVFLAAAHETILQLAVGGAAIGLGSGFLLTAMYPVVLRGAGTDVTGIAVAVLVVFRNTAVSVGVTVAFVIIAAAGLENGFRAESGYTRTFVMAAASAGLALLASALLPGRTRATAAV